MSKGLAIIFSGPSGVGKSSICKALFRRFPGLRFSVSCTTRAPREGETDGISYHFISREEFDKHIAQNDLLEFAEVHGNYYGTLKQEVLPIIEDGGRVILDIDVQGARKIRKAISGHDLEKSFISVFLAPPSLEELEHRLRGRNTETEEAILKRLSNAKAEMDAQGEYQYVVVNRDLDKAIDEMVDIINKSEG